MQPVRAKLMGCDSLQLDWSAPMTTGGFPIESYKIEILNGNNNWSVIDNCGNSSFENECNISVSDLA
jgi:hypothetical protein